jgi:hypothetical protein
MFGVTGVVTDEKGRPLEGAEVTLNVEGPVYSGVSVVDGERRVTTKEGSFVFMYTVHGGVRYSLSIRKPGFEDQSVVGNAPPPGHHTIRLKSSS